MKEYYAYLFFVFIIILIMSIFKGKHEQQVEELNFFKSLFGWGGGNKGSTPASTVISTPASTVISTPVSIVGSTTSSNEISTILDEEELRSVGSEYNIYLRWVVNDLGPPFWNFEDRYLQSNFDTIQNIREQKDVSRFHSDNNLRVPATNSFNAIDVYKQNLQIGINRLAKYNNGTFRIVYNSDHYLTNIHFSMGLQLFKFMTLLLEKVTLLKDFYEYHFLMVYTQYDPDYLTDHSKHAPFDPNAPQ
jgi:hypothetical protein